MRGGDGVSPVIIGSNDWAAAWAVDAQGQPVVDPVPGGGRQRELAIRFGINLVMYALTGNWRRADTVHVLRALLDTHGAIVATTIDFAPHVAISVLWALIAVAVLLTGFALFRRAKGAWARGLAFAVLIAALANPLIVHEKREPLQDVAVVVLDRSQSMGVDHRSADADRALAQIKKIAREGRKDLERARPSSPHQTTGEDNGTQLFAALNSALADVPPERVAGAIAITDGEVHDAPKKPPVDAPLHARALIVGAHGERDRKLTCPCDAARFAIVGQDADIALRVDDFGSAGGGSADVAIRIDGRDAGSRTVPVGQNATIHVPVAHGGENVVELEARPGPAELTLQNNRAAVAVSGVRDRLRVLLVSGEPHAGERVWRNLLKADPSVDLVHFTILRPPDKQDATPINELALIAFPHHELFVDKLNQFDLVIFDRYTRARHPAARLYSREHRDLCRQRRRAAAVGRAGVRGAQQHLPHAAGLGAARDAHHRRHRGDAVQARGDGGSARRIP